MVTPALSGDAPDDLSGRQASPAVTIAVCPVISCVQGRTSNRSGGWNLKSPSLPPSWSWPAPHITRQLPVWPARLDFPAEVSPGARRASSSAPFTSGTGRVRGAKSACLPEAAPEAVLSVFLSRRAPRHAVCLAARRPSSTRGAGTSTGSPSACRLAAACTALVRALGALLCGCFGQSGSGCIFADTGRWNSGIRPPKGWAGVGWGFWVGRC